MAHYCEEHQTAYFKRGKMKGFAHPIEDENGNPTGQWCNEGAVVEVGNEPNTEKGEQAERKPQRQTPTAPDAKSRSIERQVALKASVELAVAKIIPPTDILAKAETFYGFIAGEITVDVIKVAESIIKPPVQSLGTKEGDEFAIWLAENMPKKGWKPQNALAWVNRNAATSGFTPIKAETLESLVSQLTEEMKKDLREEIERRIKQ